jgi:integrase/recombinase XerD
MKPPSPPLRPADLAEIENFCDALWLEDGLAKATLASYRSDLSRLAGWLHEHGHEALLDLRETTLTAFVAHLSRQTRASSQARYLATLRRFYRWQVSHGRLASDPTLRLREPEGQAQSRIRIFRSHRRRSFMHQRHGLLIS